MRPALFVIGALLAMPCLAQERAPSDECRRALNALDAQEAQAASAPDRAAALKHLQALRKQAAKACLGGTGGSAPRVAPIIEPMRPVPAPPPPPPAPPPRPVAPAQAVPAPAPAPVITSCDPGGCWSSDGTRMLRVGPNTVVGPRGACTVQGSIVSCP